VCIFDLPSANTENLAKFDETKCIRGITSRTWKPEKADVCREQIQTCLLPLILKTGGKLCTLTYSDPQLDIVPLRRPLKYAVLYIGSARNLNAMVQTGNSCEFLAWNWTLSMLGGINVHYCTDYCIDAFCLIINSTMKDLS
jgi:hypothetical protein